MSRGERGFALPVALVVLMVVLMLGSVALLMALRSLESTNRDRRVKRALAAADGSVDTTVYRMNKTLVSSPITGALGVASEIVTRLGCVTAEVPNGGLSVSTTTSGGWCPPDVEGAGRNATASSQVRFGLEIDVANVGRLVERKIVGIGRVGNVQRRILVTVRGESVPSDVLSLFKRYRYVECTPYPTDPADPSSGCPGG